MTGANSHLLDWWEKGPPFHFHSGCQFGAEQVSSGDRTHIFHLWKPLDQSPSPLGMSHSPGQ